MPLLLFLLLSDALAGAVEARWGTVGRWRHDEVFTQAPYAGLSPVHLGLALDVGEATRHRLDLGFDLVAARAGAPYGADRTDGEPFVVGASPFARVDLRWTSTWTVAGPLRVGFAVHDRVDTTSYDHGFVGVFGYTAAFGVGPAVAATWSLTDRVRVDLGADAPLVAWVARSPYAMNDDAYIRAIASHRPLAMFGALIAGGAPTTVDRLQAARAGAAISVELDPRWALLGRFDLAALRHTRPRPVLDLTASLEAGLAARW